MMHTAQRLKTEPAWLAWIPIVKFVLVAKMAKMHWWPILMLAFVWVPFIGPLLALAFAVFQIIWLWNICETRKFPGWISILTIIPVLGQIWLLVLWGLLAWSK